MACHVFSRFRPRLAGAVLLGLLAAAAGSARAGGGPENVLLVVNRNSPASLTIANHYVRLRHIPAGNVLTLDWDPLAETTDAETFRRQILLPVLGAIERRRLVPQIDYIVYSSDFPWGIDLKGDVKRFLEAMPPPPDGEPQKDQPPRQWPQQLTQVGSINGLTYLWQPVLARNPVYMQLQINRYMRLPVAEQKDAPTLGFKAVRQFGPKGDRVASDGLRYFLSTMLGVTAGRGNSVDEVLSYLRRSARADGTHPRGTVYFVQNSDVRSKARQGLFPEAVEGLRKLGVKAEVLEGTVPRDKPDVQGAAIGVASFDWKASGSTILPGAVCEHFTSFGGAMRRGAGQTPLSEWLRYGAAASSGTVTEPYSIAQKFPTAMLHVHYARGCTAAEAFYQSVFGPYQLLIVGDPLCRPWARIPEVAVEGVAPGAVVRGQLTLKPSATVQGGKVARFELYVDGWLRAACAPGETFPLDTAALADGYHELRVVAVEDSPIESQGRRILSVVAANHGRTIRASTDPPAVVRAGGKLVVTASAPNSPAIAVLHNSRLLGTIAGESGRLEIDPETLGAGPVELRLVGLGQGGPDSYVWAEPIELTVEEGR